MATLFLLLIYLTFISLGLPDSMLGASWPAMRVELGASLDTAGAISIIIAAGTVASSLFSEKLVRRFGAGRVTAVSVSATALALLAASFAGSVPAMMLIAVPLGLGGGAVDSVLNNYVALHYQPRHMSWLHSFWGIGAFLGPAILGLFLQAGSSWRTGYRAIGLIQCAVCALLFFSLPLWNKRDKGDATQTTAPASADKPGAQTPASAAAIATPPLAAGATIRLPGVVPALLTFFFYCSVETSIGLWGSSFLAESRGFSAAWAAAAVSLFYVGITAGRILSGFLTYRLSGKVLIRAGILCVLAGAGLLCLPLPGFAAALPLPLIGLGCAPIYPCMIHETPARFGAANSQKIIGWQMATAYSGNIFMPPILGLVAARTGVRVFPLFLLAFAAAMLLFSERVNRSVAARYTPGT